MGTISPYLMVSTKSLDRASIQSEEDTTLLVGSTLLVIK